MRHPVLSHFLYINMIKSVCSVSKFPFLIISISVITKLFKAPSHHVTARKIRSFLRAWKAFPQAAVIFRQTERQVKIGVYLELGHRGHSIPSGGKLSSKLEANKAAPHKLINQQRQINSDKHRGHFCPFQSFMGVENNAVSNLWTLWDINITITNIRPLS